MVLSVLIWKLETIAATEKLNERKKKEQALLVVIWRVCHYYLL
jgi:hypothetical protein